MRNKTFTVFVILLLSTLAPLCVNTSDPAQTTTTISSTARAASADINITQIEWIGPSYYCNPCITDVLAPGPQEVRITLANDGLLSGMGALTVFIDSADGMGYVTIDSQSVNLLPGAVAQYVFSWTATPGINQQIRAHAQTIPEINPSNNLLEQFFDVTAQNTGEVYSDTLPSDGARLSLGEEVVSVGVRNTGNLDTEATPIIVLTPLGGGTPVSFTGSAIPLPAGSIASPPPVELASLVINASSLSGDYTLSGDVFFNSTTPPLSDIVSITPRTITFSPYRTILLAPSDRAVEPGGSTTLTFMVQNVGDAPDRYNYTITDVQGWAAISGNPSQTEIVNASSSTTIVISVTVPFGTDRSLSDLITVEIESEGGEYNLSNHAAIMAGDLLLGELNRTTGNWLVPIIPGTEETIQYTLRNNGTSPAIFNLEAGFSQTAPGWSVEIHPSTTPYMTVGEEIIINAVVQPPALSLPFDPTTKLAEGNQLTLWTAITPVGGGPNVQQTTLEIQPTMMIELFAEQTEFSIDPSELLIGPISRFVDIEMELRHNLVSGIATAGGADIQLTSTPIEFTSSRTSSGPNEILRWNSSVAPNQTTMAMGDSEPLVATILGPSDMLPLAGSLVIDVVANLTLLGSSGGIEAPESNISITLSIPELTLADVEIPPPTTVTPEIMTSTPIIVSNTGNHESNLSLSVEGPEGWITSITPTSITDLNSIVDAWPSVGGDNVTTTLSVTAPQNTRADTPFDVNITVSDDMGEILTTTSIPFLVEEVIGASLSPEYAVAVIPVNGNSSIALEANNTGNSLQTFTIEIEETLEDINLTLISSPQIAIEPGEVSIVQIEVTAEQFARADENHSAQAVMYHNGVELDRIDVYVEMIPNHQIEFEHATEYSVVPGMSLSIPVNVTNAGNLEEFINFTTIPPEGWQSSVTPLNMTIDGEGIEILPLIVDVTIPPMSTDAGLEPGSIHNLFILANNVTDSIQVGMSTIQFNVEPVFVLSSDDFPDIVELLPGEQRTFDIEISNDGNQDVILDLDCEVDNPNRWDVSACDATNLTLDSGEVRTVSFSVQGIASDHYNLEQSDLRLTFSPQDNHSGDALLATVLRISRIHIDEPVDLSGGESTHDIEIDWMHVQGVGQTADSSPIGYELELVNESRYINESLYPGDLAWDLEIDYGNGFVPLFDNGPFTLNSVAPLQQQTMTIRANLPPSVNIPPGDGYTLKFNLTHPTELTTTELTLDLRVDAWADPAIISITIDGDSSIVESMSGTLYANIQNAGNAGTALGVVATLECTTGITIDGEATQPLIGMQPFETRQLEWQIQSNALNWWSSDEVVPCTVTIEAPDMAGDDESNDIKSQSMTIESWSLPLLVLIPITFSLVTVSSRLLRRASEDERSLMLCAYSGTALLGIATQYNLGSYVNFSLAATALLWVAFITSRTSAFEIPAILSDRQNMQRGSESIFEDHEQEMDRVLKQLAAKLAFAPLGFILVAIIMPNDISWALANIGSIILYVVSGALVVTYMTLRTRNIWLTIFDQLAAMEIESQELLVQLGNPSADLRRITIGQRWGEAHDVSVEVDADV